MNIRGKEHEKVASALAEFGAVIAEWDSRIKMIYSANSGLNGKDIELVCIFDPEPTN